MYLQILALLSTLPFLAAAPSPEPHRPFVASDLNALFSRDQLVSRAHLEAVGREALAMAPVKLGAQARERGAIGKRGKRGDVRRVHRRLAADACLPVVSGSQTLQLSTPTLVTSSSFVESTPTLSTSAHPSTRDPIVAASLTLSSSLVSPTSESTTTSSTHSTTNSPSSSSTKHHKTSSTTAHSSSTTVHSVSSTTSTSVTPNSTAGSGTTTAITVDSAGNGPFSGWGTWFDDGIGACGWTNTAADP